MPDSLWEYGHYVHNCSKQEEHMDDCDGTCNKVPAPDSVVDLHNEALRWAQRGMVAQGVPMSMSGGPFAGIGVEILQVECRLAGLIKYLEEAIPDFDEDKASDLYREVLVGKMKSAREQFDAAQKDIQVAKAPLLGPNGEIIH